MQIQISWLLQKPTDLDLHCLQRHSITRFSTSRVNQVCSVCHSVGTVKHITRTGFKCASYLRMFCPGFLLLLVLIIRYRDPGQNIPYHSLCTSECSPGSQTGFSNVKISRESSYCVALWLKFSAEDFLKYS